MLINLQLSNDGMISWSLLMDFSVPSIIYWFFDSFHSGFAFQPSGDDVCSRVADGKAPQSGLIDRPICFHLAFCGNRIKPGHEMMIRGIICSQSEFLLCDAGGALEWKREENTVDKCTFTVIFRFPVQRKWTKTPAMIWSQSQRRFVSWWWGDVKGKGLEQYEGKGEMPESCQELLILCASSGEVNKK